jgi:hypothetical protein
LPEEARNVLNNILHKIFEKTIKWTKWLLRNVREASSTSTKIAVWALVAWCILLLLFGWKFRAFTQGVWVASLAGAAGYIYDKFMEDPNARKFLEEKWIDRKKFTKEIEKTTIK